MAHYLQQKHSTLTTNGNMIKTHESPPLMVEYCNDEDNCYFDHQFKWTLTPLKEYEQEICINCGATRETKKL